MQLLDFKTCDGRATVLVGDADMFAEDEGVAGAVLGQLEGKVAWIEWLEATRPRSGNALIDTVLATLNDLDVVAVGAQVVPIGALPETKAVTRLAAFYARHGFADASHLAPWSEWPVMVVFLGESR